MRENTLEKIYDSIDLSLADKEEENLTLSHKARFLSFKHRSKVEFLKFFIV